MLTRLHTWLARLAGFLRPGAADRDFDDELAAHLALAEDAKVRAGMPRAAARRAARIELGGVAQLREAGRAARGLPSLTSAGLDVRLGIRLLAKHPTLTIVATLALSVAIAIVGGVHAATQFIVHPSLPVPEGERVVAIWYPDAGSAGRGALHAGDVAAWRAGASTLDDVGAFVRHTRLVSTTSSPPRAVAAARIDPSAFRMLRVAPRRGRVLVDADAAPGAPRVVLIGADLSTSLFGEDSPIGATLQVGTNAHTVVGVMPEGFGFPVSEQLWLPVPFSSPPTSGDGDPVELAFARLADGASLDEARAELAALGTRSAALGRGAGEVRPPRVAPYARSFFETTEPELPQLMRAGQGFITLLLLIVGITVGTLVYARNTTRVDEIVVRMALGASRRRIASQLFVEGLVLSSVAAVLGTMVMLVPLAAIRGVFVSAGAQIDDVPFWISIGFGARTALLVGGLTLLSAVLTGLLPALKLTNRGMQTRLQRVHDRVSGLRFGRAATAVVIAQVALSVALLAVGSSQLLTFVEDWRARGAATVRAGLITADARWDAEAEPLGAVARRAAYDALARRVTADTGVTGATLHAPQAPRPFTVAGAADAPPRWALMNAVAPDYFDVLGTALLAGRMFAEAPGTPVAVVNQAFVEARLPPGPAVGRRIQAAARDGEPALEIIGVVEDVPGFDVSPRGPRWAALPTVYVPLATAATAPVQLVVRAGADPASVATRLPALAAGGTSGLALTQPRLMSEAERIGLMVVGLYWVGVGLFVAATLLLATMGVYALLAFTVRQREREIGIRAALGAAPRRLALDVFARALRQVGAGTSIGLAIGALAAAGPFASSNLLGGGARPLLGTAALILGMGVVACAVPLRRALRISPTDAMRGDA